MGLLHCLPFFFFFLDLRKFRTYKGSSVRDLLRAMRNKVRAEGARRGRAGPLHSPLLVSLPHGCSGHPGVRSSQRPGGRGCPGHISGCSFPWMSLLFRDAGAGSRALGSGFSRHMLARCPLPAWTALDEVPLWGPFLHVTAPPSSPAPASKASPKEGEEAREWTGGPFSQPHSLCSSSGSGLGPTGSSPPTMCLCPPICRSTTTGSCPRRCRRRWAPSPTTSCATSPPASPTCSHTPTAPWSCAATRGPSSPTTTSPPSPSPP